jgi:hypothetical protein
LFFATDRTTIDVKYLPEDDDQRPGHEPATCRPG